MSETDENRKIQMITRLLEKGGTMLASHHECGAPLFRYQGKVLCPVCDFQEKKEVQETKLSDTKVLETKVPETKVQEIKRQEEVQRLRKQEEMQRLRKQEEMQKHETRVEKGPEITGRAVGPGPVAGPVIVSEAAGYDQIAVLIKNKIHNIAASLDGETDLQRVKEKMDCIEMGIRILKLIES